MSETAKYFKLINKSDFSSDMRRFGILPLQIPQARVYTRVEKIVFVFYRNLYLSVFVKNKRIIINITDDKQVAKT